LRKSVGASAESKDLCSTRGLELTMIDRPINQASRSTGSRAYEPFTLSNVDTLAVAGPGPYISHGCYIINFQKFPCRFRCRPGFARKIPLSINMAT
jgi:hypothetical protein